MIAFVKRKLALAAHRRRGGLLLRVADSLPEKTS